MSGLPSIFFYWVFIRKEYESIASPIWKLLLNIKQKLTQNQCDLGNFYNHLLYEVNAALENYISKNILF